MTDKTLKDYCMKHGFCINQDGKIELTRKQADYEKRCGYLEKSLFGPDLVWVVPSESGTVLIYEHKHFIVK